MYRMQCRHIEIFATSLNIVGTFDDIFMLQPLTKRGGGGGLGLFV